MDTNQIKKELYRNKPVAILQHIHKGYVLYKTSLNEDSIYFNIPVEDMGDGMYLNEMQSQLLIRWIVQSS